MSRPTTFDQHQRHLEQHDQPERKATQETEDGLPFIYQEDNGVIVIRASDRDSFESRGWTVAGTISTPGTLPCLRMSIKSRQLS